MKTLKRFFVAAALVVVGALGVPAGALAQLTIEASGVPDSGVTTWTFGVGSGGGQAAGNGVII